MDIITLIAWSVLFVAMFSLIRFTIWSHVQLTEHEHDLYCAGLRIDSVRDSHCANIAKGDFDLFESGLIGANLRDEVDICGELVFCPLRISGNLLPRLGTELRSWVRKDENVSARDAISSFVLSLNPTQNQKIYSKKSEAHLDDIKGLSEDEYGHFGLVIYDEFAHVAGFFYVTVFKD